MNVVDGREYGRLRLEVPVVAGPFLPETKCHAARSLADCQTLKQSAATANQGATGFPVLFLPSLAARSVRASLRETGFELYEKKSAASGKLHVADTRSTSLAAIHKRRLEEHGKTSDFAGSPAKSLENPWHPVIYLSNSATQPRWFAGSTAANC
jgi:hypothetical protein